MDDFSYRLLVFELHLKVLPDFGYKMLVSAKKVMSKSKEKLHFTSNFNIPE